MTNTSVKLAGGVSFADAHALAPNMGTTHEFISSMRKRPKITEFAAYVRNVTPDAIRLTVPFGTLEGAPRMSRSSFELLLRCNRERYAANPALPRPSPPNLDTARPSATEAAHTPTAAPTTPPDDDWRS
jgi:hypothetical protein